jgi:acetyl esterase
MPLHPDAARAIQEAGDLPAHLAPHELRRVYHEQRIKLLPDPLPVGDCEAFSIPGRSGEVPVRSYRPLRQSPHAGLLLFFHGGGWMLGSLESYDTVCRRLAAKAGCVVVSVGYRLAPEHPFPAAVEDAYDALSWCGKHAAQFGADPAKIAVCGDSAGGNLAAVIAQLDLDVGAQLVALQILIYPSTDMSRTWPSYQRNAQGYMLTTSALQTLIKSYVIDDIDRADPRASPMRRESFHGLPPALIISAEFDPLVDDNAAYAERLLDAGVPVDYVCFLGMIHPFFTLGRIVKDAERAEDLIANAMRKMATTQSDESMGRACPHPPR